MIIVRLSGGMGNQMFQYALGRTIAIKNNTSVGLDVQDLLDRTPRPGRFTFRDYDLDVFNIHAEVVPQSKVPLRYRSIRGGRLGVYLNKIRRLVFGGKGREKGFTYNPNILSIGSDAYIDGYWQSHKYFESIADTIRKDFSFKNPLPDNVQLLETEIKSKNSVCLHVRRGDYVGNPYHEVVFKDYYDEAIAVLQEKTSIEHLYVFSDDIAWCRDTMTFSHPVTFVGEEYAGDRASGHLALMRACRHFIIPNSSFAWWAAWLGEYEHKVVIAPKKWFPDSSIDTSNRIPEEWIRI